jgi:hypothetical protein
MERVDVVELEPAIDEMARRCRELNRDVLNHAKVRRIYNDGREHVFTTSQTYDIVISEPSNPYRAGVAALYTVEFYRQIRDRMNADGVFVQWVQAYEVDALTVNTVLATARSVFDHVEVWQSIPGDLQVVCSQAPILYSAADLRQRLSDDVVQEGLRAAWHIDDLEGFLAHFLANSGYVDSIARMELFVPNRDDRNFLEYGFAKTVGLSTGFTAGIVRQAAVKAGQHLPTFSDASVDWNLVETRRMEFNYLFSGDMVPSDQRTEFHRALATGFVYANADRFDKALEAWSEAPQQSPSGVMRLVLARCHAELGQAECLQLLAPIEEKYPAESAAIRATYYWQQKDSVKAVEAIEAFYDLLSHDPWAISPIVHPTLQLTVEAAHSDPAAAKRLFEKFATPLAAYRFEHQRPVLRFLIAEHLEQEMLVEALVALEPNPPWIRDTLKLRAETYAAAKHPLARQAASDWKLFQTHD